MNKQISIPILEEIIKECKLELPNIPIMNDKFQKLFEQKILEKINKYI